MGIIVYFLIIGNAGFIPSTVVGNGGMGFWDYKRGQ